MGGHRLTPRGRLAAKRVRTTAAPRVVPIDREHPVIVAPATLNAWLRGWVPDGSNYWKYADNHAYLVRPDRAGAGWRFVLDRKPSVNVYATKEDAMAGLFSARQRLNDAGIDA